MVLEQFLLKRVVAKNQIQALDRTDEVKLKLNQPKQSLVYKVTVIEYFCYENISSLDRTIYGVSRCSPNYTVLTHAR